MSPSLAAILNQHYLCLTSLGRFGSPASLRGRRRDGVGLAYATLKHANFCDTWWVGATHRGSRLTTIDSDFAHFDRPGLHSGRAERVSLRYSLSSGTILARLTYAERTCRGANLERTDLGLPLVGGT